MTGVMAIEYLMAWSRYYGYFSILGDDDASLDTHTQADNRERVRRDEPRLRC